MRRVVFVTGGAGFVGQRLLPALAASGARVVALDRSGRLAGAIEIEGVESVRADLLEPSGYRAALAGCDTVIHMAAATGKASADDHHRVNARGTEVLIEEARRAGIQNFLFVSTIAVTFSDLTGYHYAQAKVVAEAAVRASGLKFLIVRPTMILGAGAPLLASLEKLALLPVAVLPGNGRALVQPVHVDDVAECLVRAVGDEAGAFSNETFAIGGADRMSMEQIVRELRSARRGVTGPLVHVPLPLLQIPLRVAESVGLGKFLPITAGQLSSFKFDGLGEANRLQPAGAPTAMLADMFERAPATPAAPVGDPPTAAELDAECRVFTRYLTGQAATDYVLEKYRAAHARIGPLRATNSTDHVLVDYAARGVMFAKLADAHAALLAPTTLLRKKLVLLLAILETCPPYYKAVDSPVGGSPVPAILRLMVTGVVSVLSLAIGSLILIPVRILGSPKAVGRS